MKPGRSLLVAMVSLLGATGVAAGMATDGPVLPSLGDRPPNVVEPTSPNLVEPTPPNLVESTPRPNVVERTPPNVVESTPTPPNVVEPTPPNLVESTPPNLVEPTPPNLVEPTPRPTAREWKSAPEFRLTRSNDARCKARRLREWVRIRCAIPGSESISLLGGNRADVDLWIEYLENPDFGDGAVLEMPIRRGDRRVFQVSMSAGKYGNAPAAIVSEQWLEGDAAPLITVNAVSF